MVQRPRPDLRGGCAAMRIPTVTIDALNAALADYGNPEISNTDQGSQFTGFDFTGVLKNAGVRISMDGRGRCMDNIFIERLWRSLKYLVVSQDVV